MSTLNRSLKPLPPTDPTIVDDSDIPAATSTVSDDFDDNVIDISRWTSSFFIAGNTTVAETGGQLVFTPQANTASYRLLSTNYGCSLVDETISLDYISFFNSGPGYEEQNFRLEDIADPTNNYIDMVTGGGWLTCRIRNSGSTSSVGNTSGHEASKLRMRYVSVSNTAYLEYWNGSSWVTKHSATLTWVPSNVRVVIYAGYWGTGNSSTTPMIVDNLVLTGESTGLPPTGAATVSWNTRNRLVPAIQKQTDPSNDLEVGQTHTVKVYGEDGTTLLRTATGITYDFYEYEAGFEQIDTGLSILQTELTFKIFSVRDGFESLEAVKTLVR